MSNHVLPLSTYFRVFGSLLVLTGVTTGVAYLDLGPLNDPVALLIAGTKATLVLLFFMHVKYASRVIWVFSAAGFFWLLIFFVLILTDYSTRVPIPGWEG